MVLHSLHHKLRVPYAHNDAAWRSRRHPQRHSVWGDRRRHTRQRVVACHRKALRRILRTKKRLSALCRGIPIVVYLVQSQSVVLNLRRLSMHNLTRKRNSRSIHLCTSLSEHNKLYTRLVPHTYTALPYILQAQALSPQNVYQSQLVWKS